VALTIFFLTIALLALAPITTTILFGEEKEILFVVAVCTRTTVTTSPPSLKAITIVLDTFSFGAVALGGWGRRVVEGS
jgi:hypothetical protein